ncbi:Na+/H+ antiporter NhaA [Serratia ureilytica]
MILPLFAFANAGVSLQGVSLEGLTSLLPVGIAAGLFIGKPLGIFLFSLLAVKMGIARLPEGIGFKQVFAVSVLCGIGFTMSILSPRWRSAMRMRRSAPIPAWGSCWAPPLRRW